MQTIHSLIPVPGRDGAAVAGVRGIRAEGGYPACKRKPRLQLSRGVCFPWGRVPAVGYRMAICEVPIRRPSQKSCTV